MLQYPARSFSFADLYCWSSSFHISIGIPSKPAALSFAESRSASIISPGEIFFLRFRMSSWFSFTSMFFVISLIFSPFGSLFGSRSISSSCSWYSFAIFAISSDLVAFRSGLLSGFIRDLIVSLGVFSLADLAQCFDIVSPSILCLAASKFDCKVKKGDRQSRVS